MKLETTNNGGMTLGFVELLFEVEGKSTSATGGTWTKEFIPPLETGDARAFWIDPNATFDEGETDFSVSVWFEEGKVGSVSTSIEEW